MTIYTVVSVEDDNLCCVHGSYVSRGDAVRKCADVMIERLKEDDVFYEAFSHDEIHGDIVRKMPPEPDEDMSDARSEIVDELGGAGEYIVCDNFGREFERSSVAA